MDNYIFTQLKRQNIPIHAPPFEHRHFTFEILKPTILPIVITLHSTTKLMHISKRTKPTRQHHSPIHCRDAVCHRFDPYITHTITHLQTPLS
ncbi:hypothetical protein Hanom_Chr13g01214891 [Helianthus anomalus]